MAFEPFNSVGGYTVGIPPTPIINENGVATLNGLQVSGLSNLGSVGNVRILGGTSGYYLQTNGLGNLTWVPSGGNVTPGGSNTQVQFNDAGNFGGDAGFTYDSINNILSVSGNIISTNFVGTGNITIASINANGNITANYFIGNGSQLTDISATTANFANYAGNVTISSQPNITSVGTLVSLDVTGNVTAGKVKTDYLLYANGDQYQFTTNAAGTNTQVQFNNNNAFSASANFTFDNTTNTLAVTNITSNGAGLSSLTGANVTGQVSYSNIANSVAVANVVGIGNISVINLDGNGSNVLHGNGYWGPESGNGSANYANFAGTAFNVSGSNVTGEVANAIFATNANVANTAGTVTTNAQPNITSVGNLSSLSITGNVIANSYQMGSGVYKFYTQSVYFSTTTSTSPNQVIWSVPVANVSAVDFTIIATDSVGNSRQQCKITATILGSAVVYNEYAGLYINGGVGSFSVAYAGGGTPSVQLLVTPDSVNLTEYSILIAEYTP
jgi:hypothetical protein